MNQKDTTKGFLVESAAGENLIGSKLADARKRNGFSQGQFVKELQKYGICLSQSAYSGWEHGFRTPNAYQFLGLCEALNIEDIRNYFLGDAGPEPGMERLNEEGRKKAREYIQLLMDSGRFESSDHENGSDNTEDNIVDFPLYLLAVSAGTGQFLDGDAFETVSLPKSCIPNGADFGIRIAGDSMEPLFLSGQIAFVQKTVQLHPKDIGIFIVDGESYIKQYGEIMPETEELNDYVYSTGNVQKKPVLISMNKKYPPMVISRDQRFEIVGKVLNQNGFDLL